jgi:hypothetical protein
VTAPAIPVPPPAGTTAASRPVRRPRTRRNTELALLAFAMLLVTAYAAACEAGQIGEITVDFWVPVALLALIFTVAHGAIRLLAPYADPVLLPAVCCSRRSR